MAGFVVVDVTVTDDAAYQEYARQVPPTVSAYDGEYVMRGGKVDAVEGDWQPERFVVIRFPSVARAHQWHDSPEYAPLIPLRHASAITHMIIVEGV